MVLVYRTARRSAQSLSSITIWVANCGRSVVVRPMKGSLKSVVLVVRPMKGSLESVVLVVRWGALRSSEVEVARWKGETCRSVGRVLGWMAFA